MNAIDPRVISHYAAGPAAAAVQHGAGIHLPVILLGLIVIGAAVFGVSRTRRGRSREHDDQWGRRESPPAPPAQPGPPLPPGPAGPAAPPDAAPNGDPSPAPARTPRPGLSFERPADGWAVETDGLTKRFGANVAVNDVELRVPRGYAFGYLGPNGAGKTTLIRTRSLFSGLSVRATRFD